MKALYTAHFTVVVIPSTDPYHSTLPVEIYVLLYSPETFLKSSYDYHKLGRVFLFFSTAPYLRPLSFNNASQRNLLRLANAKISIYPYKETCKTSLCVMAVFGPTFLPLKILPGTACRLFGKVSVYRLHLYWLEQYICIGCFQFFASRLPTLRLLK